MEKAIFGAGCFWGVEAAFRQEEGVVSTAVGYSGGASENPTYEEVCTGRTGHAEVVQVEFDPDKISFEDLLNLFWAVHDPTTLNRQGPDVGTQYRSAVFFLTPKQEAAALASKAEVERVQKERRFRWFQKEIVTEISPASAFYMAEDYHQQYFEKRGLVH